MSKSVDTAKDILDASSKYGFSVEVRGGILTLRKQIIQDDMNSFREADMTYGCVFDRLPRTSAGSQWGTDGGGVGALAAIKSGQFIMNMSGGSVRVLNALKKQNKIVN